MSSITMKKMNETKKCLIDFLNENRCRDNLGVTPTHMSWGSVIQGKFYISNENINKFIELYINAIKSNVTDLSILEVQKEYSPIIVDIDLKSPTLLSNERLYNTNLVKNIIRKYVSIMDKYFIYNEHNFQIYLFEKQKPTQMDGIFKDGFHILFPYVIASSDLRHLIRYQVVELCNDDNTFETYLEAADKIVDKAVVSSNGWFMYGSRKPGGQTYTLTQVFNHSGKKCTLEKTQVEDLIVAFSLTAKSNKYTEKYKSKYLSTITDEIISDTLLKYNTSTCVTRPLEKKLELSESKTDIINKVYKFINMLDSSRADNYEDWRNVGLALHTTDTSLLNIWIEFSSKSPKFDESSCYKYWNSFKTPLYKNLLTIRSLAYWAKMDSPKDYQNYITEEFKKFRDDSISGSTYKIAKTLQAKYSDYFVCSSIKNNIWWEFKDHRWSRKEDAYSLRILLSEDFQNDYRMDTINLATKAMSPEISEEEKKRLQEKITSINKIIDKLMNIDGKKKIIEEAKTLFYDGKFDEKLDINVNLIGFENGVYDLEKKIFRDGHPDDFISLCTRVNYMKFSERMPFYKDIQTFFIQILPQPDVRDYFITALATCVSGETKEEKFYILTGCGSNGKSLTMDLMTGALGDYFMACPITIVTKKRNKSNETSPEKVRMKGKRCGVFQETDDGENLNVGVMKEFTGGDKILVRDLFKGADEMLEFKPQMKYFLTCNQLPAVPSNDDGTWRRLRVIDFNSKFVDNPVKSNEFKINTGLKQNLKNWSSTFASYLIHIYETKYKNISYLKEPKEVMLSTNQYKMSNDYYTEFVATKLNITDKESDKISKEILYSDFKSWFLTVTGKNELKLIPRKLDFDKQIAHILDVPDILENKFFHKITFKINTESNDLDV